MNELTTVGCATQSSVRHFNNSDLSINLTSILILNNETNEFEPWFIAKEVATLLGYEKTKEAINRHVDELDQRILSYNECKELFGKNIISDETIENIDDFGGPINEPSKNSININANGMKFINESGLYTLIARSDKREARKFQRWVTSEVLPSIRKTGSYNIQSQQLTPSYMIEDRIKRASVWIEEQKQMLQLEAELTNVSEQKERLALENKTLEAELTEVSKQLTDMGDELEIAKSEMFTNKQVFEIVRNKFTISYADSTLKAKLGKALKSISTELNERIFYNKVTVDDIVRTTPYYAKRAVNKLLSYLEKDINYLKSIK